MKRTDSSVDVIPQMRDDVKDDARKRSSLTAREKEEIKRLQKENSKEVNATTEDGTSTANGGAVPQIFMSGWVKLRNPITKLWVNRWAILTPGTLIYYKSTSNMLRQRASGILRLADCEVQEHSTTKEGFAFKIVNTLHRPIYQKHGLRGETLKFPMVPGGWSYCIFRVTSEQEKRSWISPILAQIQYANANNIRNTDNQLLLDQAQMNLSPEEEDEEEEEEDGDIVGDIKEDGNGAVVVGEQEVAEEMFIYSEEFEQKLMGDLASQQKTSARSLQKATLKSVEDWKKDVALRIANMEKRLLLFMTEVSGINSSGTDHHSSASSSLGRQQQHQLQQHKGLGRKLRSNGVSWSLHQLLLFILFSFLISKYIWRNYLLLDDSVSDVGSGAPNT